MELKEGFNETRRNFLKSSSIFAALSAFGFTLSANREKLNFNGEMNLNGNLISDPYSLDLKNDNYNDNFEIINARGGEQNLNNRLDLMEKGIFNILRHPFNGYKNDREAIQAAINYANKTGGGIVLLPARSIPYKLDENIKLLDGVSLIGQGDCTFLDARGISIKGDGSIGEQLGAIWSRAAENISISNLRIEGDGKTSLIALEGCSRVKINKCNLMQDTLLNKNVTAIGIYDNPELNSKDYSYDIQILNNIIKPSCTSILIQGREEFEIHRVHIIGNQIDGSNINAPHIFPAGIKVDKNVHQSIVAFNSIDGVKNIYDGINVQEIIYNVGVIGNLIKGVSKNLSKIVDFFVTC